MKRSPLFLAVTGNHLKMTKLLLKHDASVHIIDTERNTVCHVASEKGYNEILSLILERKPNLVIKNY